MRSLGDFDEQLQGTVDANGDLTIRFTCPLNQQWRVKSTSLEMPDAPVGAVAVIRKGGVLVAPSPDAKSAAAGGEPAVPVRSGESISVVWSDATPGDIGIAWIIYEKLVY